MAAAESAILASLLLTIQTGESDMSCTNCRLSIRLLLLCGLLGLAACGQKGPLYLPDETDADRTEESTENGDQY